jgi:hypothetical protein
MAHGAQRPEIVWSASRAERERAEAEIAGDGLHLSRAQRWDLARICVAALASAAFFSSPFLLSRDPLPAADAAVSAPSIPIERASPPHALDRIAIVTTDLVVPVRAVLMESVHRSAIPEPRPVTVRASTTRTTARPEDRSLPRRLGRAIVGDGRYTVRPFPTLDANGPQ